jgi:DnaK suppressor protein
MASVYPTDFLKNQKEKLLALKQDILNSMRNKPNDDILVSPDQTVEDGDQAQTYLNQNVSFGLREREIHRLREIEAALDRIERGTYGVCEETDEPIGKKRLEKMPWTRLSIEAAEALERESAKVKVS